ncbi:hypothetical protein HBI24_109150 [Parastagonospora nodorum]|nr:hypothetical protein HBI24_109150 [Parastagonospora nodorum]
MFYVNVSDTTFFLLHVQPSHLDQLAHEIRLLCALLETFACFSSVSNFPLFITLHLTTQEPRLPLQLPKPKPPLRTLIRPCTLHLIPLLTPAAPAITRKSIVLQLPRPQLSLVDHITVRNCDLFTNLDVSHSMDDLLANRRVPAEGRIRIASMVEARGVREDRGAVVQLHAVDLEDGDQTGFLADACVVLFADALALARLDALVDARGPDLGVLAVAGVQGEVLRLLLRGEFVEGGLDIGREVAGDGDDEERAVSEDAGPKLDGGCGDAAVAFVREGADGIVWVGWVRAPRYTALLSHMRI